MILTAFHRNILNDQSCALLRIVFLILLTSVSHITNAAVKPGISLLTDTDAVYFGDSVIVEVEAIGIIDDLDISPLFQGADLLRETTGTRIAVIDDRVVEVKLRRMEFLPRREGRILFGPLSGDSINGPVSSNTIIVNVQPPADTNWVPDDNDLQINIQLSTDDQQVLSRTGSKADTLITYIGQRIIADIELKHQHPIAEEELVLPAFDGFDVLTEFEERRTLWHDEKTDTQWRVTAWRYHLFAQYSGTHSIENISWRGTTIRSRTQRASFEQSLDGPGVNARPALAEFSWWLPASQVSLHDTWSTDVRTLAAGDEFTRTITLEARDVLSNHLPVIEPLESRAITSTLIRQERSQQLVGEHIQARATFEFRMVAQSPIPVFLDTVRVLWFDTLKKESREAIIPARRINVGLPDRKDLLAELALQDRFSDKWLYKVRSVSEKFAFWQLSLAILCVVLFCLLALISYIEIRSRRVSFKNPHTLPDL